MRLAKLDRGHTIGKKLMMGVFTVLGRTKLPDSIKTLLYRPEFFGTPHTKLQHAVMRGPSFWTVAERELMATFVSERNKCRFCTRMHRAVAEAAGVAEVIEAALMDPTTAAVRSELAAVLVFLDKLTVDPDKITRADVALVRAARVTDEALVDAIHVCFAFCVMNRVMDAFGAESPTHAQLAFVAKTLLNRGYELP
jgi:uncharacterized peroxidase-related enzyme